MTVFHTIQKPWQKVRDEDITADAAAFDATTTPLIGANWPDPSLTLDLDYDTNNIAVRFEADASAGATFGCELWARSSNPGDPIQLISDFTGAVGTMNSSVTTGDFTQRKHVSDLTATPVWGDVSVHDGAAAGNRVSEAVFFGQGIRSIYPRFYNVGTTASDEVYAINAYARTW